MVGVGRSDRLKFKNTEEKSAMGTSRYLSLSNNVSTAFILGPTNDLLGRSRRRKG